MNTSEKLDLLLPARLKAQSVFKTPIKDMQNEYLGNWYSSLEACMEAVKEGLIQNDLFITYTSDYIDGVLLVTTRLWHASGQWMESTCYLPEKEGKISPQIIGSALSYGKRYSLKMLLALGDAEQEDDAEQATSPDRAESDQPITIDQVEKLDEWLRKTNADHEKFCQFMKVKQMADLKQSDFKRAIAALKRKAQQESE